MEDTGNIYWLCSLFYRGISGMGSYFAVIAHMLKSVLNNNNNNDITSMALKSSEARAQKRNKNKISNHIQEPGTYRDHHQF